jgi:hypothetical protein
MATSTASTTHLTTPRGPHGLWDALAEASNLAPDTEGPADAHLAFMARVDADPVELEMLDEVQPPSPDEGIADVIELRDFLARRR